MKKLIIILCLMALPVCVYAKTTYEIGQDYFYKKDYTNAKTYFLKEINKHPENYQCRYFLGLTYNYTKENDKAITEFKKVTAQAPQHSMIHQYATSALQKLQPAQPSSDAKNRPAPAAQAQNEDISDNYFNTMKTGNKLYRWKTFPIKVYIGPYEHTQWVKRAFWAWQKASKNMVSFTFTDNKEEAQITISPTDGALPTNDGGLLLGVTGTTYYLNSNYLHSADIKILRKDPKTKARLEGSVVYSVIIHEAGHALGLGHSPDCKDIMSTGCTKEEISAQTITKRDLNTLKLLYR